MDIPFDLHDLEKWLDVQSIGHGPLQDVELLAGGTQNILLRFRRAGIIYVLRRPPRHPRNNSSETMRREARVLGALAETTVPHPRLIGFCDDDTPLGSAFYVMENVDGVNVTTGMAEFHKSSALVRHAMGLALVDAIGALALCDYRALGLETFGKADGFLSRQVQRWSKQLEDYSSASNWPGPRGLPEVDRIAEWLDGNIPSDYRPGLIHGDFHLANVLFERDAPQVAAIIDWELSTIGDPLLDLGWLLSTWPDPTTSEAAAFKVEPWEGFPTESELVRRYHARTGRSVASLDWYVVLACYKLAIILEGTYARACAGKAPAETGRALHGNAVALLNRARRRI